MKRWDVTFLVDASVTVTVDANTEDEAIALAEDLVETPTLCHQCSDHVDVTDITDLHSCTERD